MSEFVCDQLSNNSLKNLGFRLFSFYTKDLDDLLSSRDRLFLGDTEARNKIKILYNRMVGKEEEIDSRNRQVCDISIFFIMKHKMKERRADE